MGNCLTSVTPLVNTTAFFAVRGLSCCTCTGCSQTFISLMRKQSSQVASPRSSTYTAFTAVGSPYSVGISFLVSPQPCVTQKSHRSCHPPQVSSLRSLQIHYIIFPPPALFSPQGSLRPSTCALTIRLAFFSAKTSLLGAHSPKQAQWNSCVFSPAWIKVVKCFCLLDFCWQGQTASFTSKPSNAPYYPHSKWLGVFLPPFVMVPTLCGSEVITQGKGGSCLEHRTA